MDEAIQPRPETLIGDAQAVEKDATTLLAEAKQGIADIHALIKQFKAHIPGQWSEAVHAWMEKHAP